MTVQDRSSFDRLPHYRERQFVPEDADLTHLEEIRVLYSKLLGRDIRSSAELERWILDRSELEAALDQQGTVLYILMTCQTDDAARAQNYKHFIETVAPAVKPFDDRLNKKYLELLERFALDEKRYEVYTRAIRTDVELFVEKNVELQTKVDLLSQEYQSICGAMTVEFEGRERTLPEMSKFLLEPDRDLREGAWRASARRRLRDREKLDRLFGKMLALRDTIAENAQFGNFRDYTFKSLHRFDYTPRDCREYHQSVECLVVPLQSRILETRKKQMGVDALRPWDTAADPLGRPPLRPFEDVKDLGAGCLEIFRRVDGELGARFAQMAEAGLLDLASRKGKAPGGYQSTLNEARKPFIFMNAVGIDADVRTLLHEGGHAFHALSCAHEPLLDYRHGPMEFNEVASMGLELLADRYLDVFYKKAEDGRRSRVTHLEDIVSTLVWVAVIDAFQHWIYENPKHDASQRREAWLAVRKRFSDGIVEWDGLEEEHACLWHRQLHIFQAPFYYIEYGIAQLGALQLWLNAKKDWEKTLAQYRNALRLGGSRPLPELFEAAGIQFDFSERTMAPLVEAIRESLNEADT